MSTQRTLAAIAGAAFLALFMAGATGCGSPTSPPLSVSRTFNSTDVNAHNHSVTIDTADVKIPPSAGISETTSSNVGHTHSFAMSQAQLTAVAAGTAVTITTGVSDFGGSHTHDFTVSKWF